MKRLLALVPLLMVNLAAKDNKVDPEEIIQKFAASESAFRDIWQKYTYNQQIVFEVLNRMGTASERRVMEIEVFFTTDGERKTRVVSDRGQLRSVGITEEDLTDAVEVQPFVLTTEELPNYKIKYKGQEWVDELDTYVFEVEPRKIEKGKRYFKGKIWVETVDYQIVMTRGKAVPDYQNNKFPEFETRREQIDGKYWFPTWTEADDVLRFGGGFYNSRDVHIRELITYSDFRKFEVDTDIKYGPLPETEQPSDQ